MNLTEAHITRPTPLADLIRTRMQQLNLTEEALGRRLGYTNAAKAAGRVHALCNGLPLSAKSRHALWRLPEALEISPAIVLHAVADTERLFAQREREAEELLRLQLEVEEAAWRASFRPHAVIQSEHMVPTQITFCGLTGGARRWLIIPLDLSRPPLTYVQQALDALPGKTMARDDGGRAVMFFGRALGLIINFAPDSALRCDLEGNPLEVLAKAYRPGEVSLSFGGPRLSPVEVSRVLNFQEEPERT